MISTFSPFDFDAQSFHDPAASCVDRPYRPSNLPTYCVFAERVLNHGELERLPSFEIHIRSYDRCGTKKFLTLVI